MRLSTLSTSALVLVAACSSDPPAKPHGTVSASGARTSITSVRDVTSAMATGNADGAASAVLDLTVAGETVVTPTGGTGIPRYAMPAPAPWPTTTRESLTGTATCTPTSCTYDHFGDSSSYGTYEINGTISKSGDTLSFDLTLDVTSSELSFHWALDGSLTITDALLDGAIHSHGTATDISSSGGFDLTWDVDVAFRSIGLDVSGCAVSGSLSASVSFDETAPQGHYAYAAEGTVDFGPACGDVTIH